jgi:hypothetical protein
MNPDVPTGAMHAVKDSATSTNEKSLNALGPSMAVHSTRGSAGTGLTDEAVVHRDFGTSGSSVVTVVRTGIADLETRRWEG